MASLAYLPALMPMSRALLALVIVSTVVGTSHCLNQDGDVVILGDTNFDQLTSTGVWLVDIYAPWCSHCQQLEPTWHALAREMDAHGVNVAKVDGMQNKVLMKRFGVVGFPSIFLLRDGQTWQYTGMRSVGEVSTCVSLGAHRSIGSGSAVSMTAGVVIIQRTLSCTVLDRWAQCVARDLVAPTEQ
eukprot:GHRR01028926.1.p1 GENE.GHRR01028926.1~~GHRR01028926.1.p1  ORF type:complete len:186 (+),score=40.10 GHRR01028926.1:135-692(+)